MTLESVTNSTPNGASVNNLDQMAQLLMDDVAVDNEPLKEEKPAASIEPEVNTPPAEEKESSPIEESAAEGEEVTWSKVLGVDDKHVVLDDNGDFAAIKVKVDGKESEVKLPDLIAGYQTAKYNTQKSQALSEEVKQFTSLKDSVVQAYTSKLESVNKLTQYLEQSILRDFSGIDWDRLRAENPGEYAAAVQDLNIRKAELQKVYTTVEQEKQSELQALTAAQQAQIQQRLNSEIEKALEKNPTWSDPTVFKKDVEEMQSFVGEAYGFTPAEFETIHDHRLLELVKDAMRYKKNMQIAAEKLQKPVPKFQSPQTRKAKPVSKLDLLTKQAKAANGYRKTELQTDAIAQLLSDVGM